MDAAARHISPASPATPGTASGGVYFPLTLIRYDSGGGGFTTPDRQWQRDAGSVHGAGVFASAARPRVEIHRTVIEIRYNKPRRAV